jgi:hypothetical protein
MRDLQSVREALHSNEPATQVHMLEDLLREASGLAALAVEALAHGPNRFLIAERLPRFGAICVEPLERLLVPDADREASVLAALVLFQLGSASGQERLLEEVDAGGEYSVLCARTLSTHGVREVAPVVVARLETMPLDDVDAVVEYCATLRRLGQSLPKRFVERAKGQSVPWQVRAAIDASL